MHLHPQAQCALRIMVTLAREPLPLTHTWLAGHIRTSEPLVARTLEALELARMVKRVGDGYRLGFHPRAVYIGDIIDVAGGQRQDRGCPLATPGCTPDAPCSLCWTLVEADLAAMQVLRTQTLEDLRRTPSGRAPAVAQSA